MSSEKTTVAEGLFFSAGLLGVGAALAIFGAGLESIYDGHWETGAGIGAALGATYAAGNVGFILVANNLASNGGI